MLEKQVQLLFPFMEDVHHQDYYTYVQSEMKKLQYQFACEGINLSKNELMSMYIEQDNHNKMSSYYLSEPHTEIVPYDKYHR